MKPKPKPRKPRAIKLEGAGDFTLYHFGTDYEWITIAGKSFRLEEAKKALKVLGQAIAYLESKGSK